MLSGTASTLPSDSYFKAPATAAAAPGSSSLHHTQTSFNPLHGVPFEINPVYNFGIGGTIMNELIVIDFSLFTNIKNHFMNLF